MCVRKRRFAVWTLMNPPTFQTVPDWTKVRWIKLLKFDVIYGAHLSPMDSGCYHNEGNPNFYCFSWLHLLSRSTNDPSMSERVVWMAWCWWLTSICVFRAPSGQPPEILIENELCTDVCLMCPTHILYLDDQQGDEQSSCLKGLLSTWSENMKVFLLMAKSPQLRIWITDGKYAMLIKLL